MMPPQPPAPQASPSREAEEEGGSWYEALDLSAFVDAYASVNFDFGKPQDNGNTYRAFDRTNGFSLSWAGVDVGYQAEQVGATVSLRFGPSAAVLAGSDADHGLQFVKQAYATWRPGGGRFTIDFGKFDTVYGVEVADSQKNINYTRGLVYTLAQPHFHTGLRAGYSDGGFTATLLVVNGWNESVDKNLGKGFGLDVGYSVKRSDGSGNLLTAKIGYFLSPESQDYYTGKRCPAGMVWVATAERCETSLASPQGSETYTDDRGDTNQTNIRHFLDLAVLFEPTDALLITANGDYGHDLPATQLENATSSPPSGADWFGVSLAGRYKFGDIWASGLRFEYLSDPDHFLCNSETEVWMNNGAFSRVGLCRAAGIVPMSFSDSLGPGMAAQSFYMTSGTLTLEAAPVNHLLVRLDGRFDYANADVFAAVATKSTTQVTTTLGVVATTD